MKPNFYNEIGLIDRGYRVVAGVDEVGRGALAGPIIACAVVLDVKKDFGDVLDSKKLTAKKRAILSEYILAESRDLGIGEVSNLEIDRLGLGAANVLAFSRALHQLKRVDYALIDGRRFRGFDFKYRCLEKGGSKSVSIAAASIVAKVYRDKIMSEISDSKYQFHKNKGYGTKKHIDLLKTLGSSKHHRKTFITEILSNQSNIAGL